MAKGIFERIKLPIFDTILLPAGVIAVGGIPLFQIPQGGFHTLVPATAKTAAETNITVAGLMPYRKAAIVGIRAYFYTLTNVVATIADINQVMSCCVLEYSKQDRANYVLPISFLPAGMGVYMGGHATAGQNGIPQLSNLFRVLPETYGENERIQATFRVIVGMTMAADTRLQIVLEALVDKNF